MESQQDVLINNQLNIFIISSPLLVKVLGIKLDGDFEDRLLEKIPLSAETEITGSKNQDIEAAK